MHKRLINEQTLEILVIIKQSIECVTEVINVIIRNLYIKYGFCLIIIAAK